MEKQMKLEEELETLENIIKELESGDTNLDDAINKYTEAMKIAKSASNKLAKAEEQVNKILSENGNLEDFEVNKE
ncbi:MAG TPA: exodeoxyribonuclease VII small subunit [Mollicutes bacterium]|jgi:exodeoxyribonuclease VII small subunit|nr:exodeoxyribonuclease VII small subunit [Mollicutes bacterium]